MEEKEVGIVIHYWGKIGVAGIEITNGEVKAGDELHFLGATTDFKQVIESIQVESRDVEKAVKGNRIGLKVSVHARSRDKVFLVVK